MEFTIDDVVVLFIHRAADVPVKRRIETAMGWPVVGVRKLPSPPALDFVRVREGVLIAKDDRVMGDIYITIRFPRSQIYHLDLRAGMIALTGWRKIDRTGQWKRCLCGPRNPILERTWVESGTSDLDRHNLYVHTLVCRSDQTFEETVYLYDWENSDRLLTAAYYSGTMRTFVIQPEWLV